MPHIFEVAPTGRAKCRACGAAIVAGDVRFGERLANPYVEAADAEMTHWYHVRCAAFRRPEPMAAALSAQDPPALGLPDGEALEAAARAAAAHPRLARVDAASRAPSGRAACRSCRAPIQKGAWRIALRYYEDGRFVPSGFIHPGCALAYFGTSDVMSALRHFSPGLGDEDVAEITRELAPPPE